MAGTWPKVTGNVQRFFTATHALKVAGGCEKPHAHQYTVRFGFTHEVQPVTGLAGSKALEDWSKDIDCALALVEGKDLNLVLAPYPPTIEVLAMRLLSAIPSYFEWVEVASYAPLYTVRVERRGLRIQWPRCAACNDTGIENAGPGGSPENCATCGGGA